VTEFEHYGVFRPGEDNLDALSTLLDQQFERPTRGSAVDRKSRLS
jgi:hypothetical protein